MEAAQKINSAGVFNDQGMLLQQQGELTQALDAYHRAIVINPADTDTCNNLLSLLDLLGQHPDALPQSEVFTMSIAQAFNDLGNASHVQGRLDDAITCYQQALSLRPDYIQVHSNLGNVLKDRGQPDAAISCFRQALAIKPDIAEIHYNLAITLEQQGQIKEAIVAYEQAITFRPDLTDAYHNLGNVHKTQGH